MTKETLHAFNGQLLRVDLSNDRHEFEAIDPLVLKQYLGGAGLGATIIHREIPATVAWDDPENRLVMATGALSGTSIRGSSTLCVVTKGAMTNAAASTQANGYFCTFLKNNGFDALVLQGRAERLSYLLIQDGRLEIRDATHLAGLDTWETDTRIKQALGLKENTVSVMCIGPAGEKRVRFAAIFADRGHVAAHNGVGAVMGSKNLKAIVVVRAKKRFTLHDPPKLNQLAKEIFEITKTNPVYSQLYRYGTLHLIQGSAKTGRAPYRNYTTNVCPMTEEEYRTFTPDYLRERFKVVKEHPCWACSMHHCDVIEVPEGPLAGMETEEPEYEGLTGLGTQLGIFDGITATALNSEVDRLGMDVNETGWVLGWAIECWEKGLLTDDDTDGISLRWGDVEAVRKMLHKIAHRDGFGDRLAEGAMRAAAAIGGEAEACAVHTMAGNTPVGHDHRGVWPYLLDMAVANTGSYELHLGPNPANLKLKMPTLFDPDEVAEYTAKAKWVTFFYDSVGICRFPSREFPDLLARMLTAATGWDYSVEDITTAGYRVLNLLRAFNIRHGWDPAREKPSPRYGSKPVDGPYQDTDVSKVWDEMLDHYYRYLGWDRQSGKPTRKTLKKLALDHVIPELWDA
jgi:aldehyde:ferredoxin oxidoreductase